jgi:hypothetical protein
LFSEDEVWEVIKELPNDKAPGPDGFTGIFYKLAWDVIKPEIMNAFNAFWSQDSRSFHHLNDAYTILLKKRTTQLESETIGRSASFTASASLLPSAWPGA